MFIDFKTKPAFRPGLKNLLVSPEADVVLNCSATGYPPPSVHWENSEGRKMSDDGLLRIKNIRKSESYKCFAQNVVGNAVIMVNVTITDLPFAPKKVIAKSKTGYSITVSWEDGEPGTKIDYHEIKFRKNGDLYWKTAHGIGGDLKEYTLDDLDAYTDYEVQVFALNNAGKSKGSAVVSVKTEETSKFEFMSL